MARRRDAPVPSSRASHQSSVHARRTGAERRGNNIAALALAKGLNAIDLQLRTEKSAGAARSQALSRPREVPQGRPQWRPQGRPIGGPGEGPRRRPGRWSIGRFGGRIGGGLGVVASGVLAVESLAQPHRGVVEHAAARRPAGIGADQNIDAQATGKGAIRPNPLDDDDIGLQVAKHLGMDADRP